MKKGFFTGVISALTFLTKASLPPLLILFFFLYILKTTKFYFKKRTDKLKLYLLSIILFFVSFSLIIIPYLRESKKIFGSYFYNVNSTFYMWYDSWEDAQKGTYKYSDLSEYPKMPANLIPSPNKYFESHTFSQMYQRLINGYEEIVGLIFGTYRFKTYKKHVVYGYGKYIFIFLYIFLFSSFAGYKKLEKYFKLYSWEIIFFLGTILSYTMLAFWYVPIIPSGQRFILGLFIPFVFTLHYGSYKLFLGLKLKSKNKLFKLSVNNLVNIVLFLFVYYDIFFNQLAKTTYINGGP
ncbi:hypothetical protein ACFLZ1_05110 [Patescibacteria group bacterium]